MNKKQNIILGIDIFLISTIPILLTLWASNYTPNIMLGVITLTILGVLAGLLLPNIVVVALVILLTVIGAAILLFGYLIMPTFVKFLLLIAFPAEALLVSTLSYYLLEWGFSWRNRRGMKRYFSRHNLHLKLQTSYNAEKIYYKQLANIKNKPQWNLFTSVTLIKWENHVQFRQLHLQDHQNTLKQIADIIKKTRLTEEFIYYIDEGTFLILSPNLKPEIIKQLNADTRYKITQITSLINVQLKMAVQTIDQENYKRFSDFDVLYKHLKRELETDLVVEYLKAGGQDD